MTLIVDSEIYTNVFFIFRDNGEEVKCSISNSKVIRPDKYKLTAQEKRDVGKRYKHKHININHQKTK